MFWGFFHPLSFGELVSIFSANGESFRHRSSVNFLACKPRLYCGETSLSNARSEFSNRKILQFTQLQSQFIPVLTTMSAVSHMEMKNIN